VWRSVLPLVHLYLDWAFMGASFALALWAYLLYRGRRPLPAPFWTVETWTARALGLQILIGLALLALGLRPPDALHYLYAFLVTADVGAQEALRPERSLGRMIREERSLSEAGTYALLTVLAALFALRLYMTGSGGH
jgi:hypothetical protein